MSFSACFGSPRSMATSAMRDSETASNVEWPISAKSSRASSYAASAASSSFRILYSQPSVSIACPLARGLLLPSASSKSLANEPLGLVELEPDDVRLREGLGRAGLEILASAGERDREGLLDVRDSLGH